MIPTQTFDGFPVFGDSSAKSQPEAAVYSNGFAPADVLPAEYFNWLTNKASTGITDLNRGVSSIEAELNNVVTAGGQEVQEGINNQIITSIKYLIQQAKSEAILSAHPVHSIYESMDPTEPSVLFGGTWKRIKDRFILAAGDTYTAGDTGGSATVTLTINQIPSHTHTGPSHTHTGPSHTHSFTPSGSVSAHSHGLNNHTHSFSGTTDGMSGNATAWWTNNADTVKNEGGTSNLAWTPEADGTRGTVDLTSLGSGARRPYDNYFSGRIYKNNLNMAHTHNYSGTTRGSTANTTSVAPTFTGTAGTTGASGTGTTGASGTGTTGSTGGGNAHNNMPPYIVAYVWQRTA